MTDAITQDPTLLADGIAVIGLACRFPGAPDVETFWRNLCAGVESIRVYSDDELLRAGVDPARLADPRYVKAGAALDGIELFDAAFFGINPSIAAITDPQQRVFLELAWHALEHAGHDAERFAGDIGVFAGLSLNTYLLENVARGERFADHSLLQVAMANRGDHLATLTAYKLNLRGPAFGVQSTCSTSLSAIHLACQALLACQTDMALAGGVAVRVPQTAGYLFEEGGVASPDGHCRPFDAQAHGTVFGSGAGAVVLRRLEDALAGGDTIYAVIRGSAANNDGADKTGYTAPSAAGQARAISLAHALAGVSPETIGYVECHGTGTLLGDPIEVEALTHAFAARTARKQFCALGSVKANIGHLDTAAGIAGFIKTVLCLAHKQIPPLLHFTAPNPHIDLDAGPFWIASALSSWPASDAHPRRAGVSSFGIGGTNVHVVLEEAPPPAPRPASGPWHPLVLSARSPSALAAQTTQLARDLVNHPDRLLGDVACTLQLGRKPFEHRRVVVARTAAEAATLLDALPLERVFSARHLGSDRPVAFLFPGLGSQRPAMARELRDEIPAFRLALDEARAALAGSDGLDAMLLAELPAGALARASTAEAALFAFEYALARTLIGWGVVPRALLGDGIGEYVALCIAGSVSLADAAVMVAARGRLLDRLPAGAMTVVMLAEPELRPLLAERGLAHAMIGRSSLSVASGGVAAIADLERVLAARGVPVRRLLCDRALQASAVDAGLAELRAAVRPIRFAAPATPVVSGASPEWLDRRPDLDFTEHVADQLRRRLDLSTAIAQLYDEPDRLLLEVGPGRMLLNLARLHPRKSASHIALAALPTTSTVGPAQALTTAIGRLWTHGAAVDWAKLHAGAPYRRVALPRYPFERQRLWLDPVARVEPSAPARSPRVADWFYVPSWRRTPPAPAADHLDGPVLLFDDHWGLGALVASQLRDRGCAIVRVTPGATCDATPDGYTLDPARAVDYRELLRDLKQRGQLPARIVHLWSVDPLRRHGSRLDALARAETRGFRSLVHLAQAIGETMPSAALSLDVITSQVHAVLGNEPLCAEKATLLGPLLVIGQEYPDVRCRNIDVELPPPGSADEHELVLALIREIAGAARDACIAYRGRHRWVRAFERVRLDHGAPRLRDGGTYLITGGLGGMGLVLARRLAQLAPVRLVLVGRRPPGEPARAQIADLERMGSSVMVAAADVTDRAQLTGALVAARQRFGPLHGLIHAAGVPATGAIQRKTDQSADQVLAAKTRGTLLLDELLAADPLDFAVYCGSRTALLGGFGQADYAAANAFLDAFAHEHSRRSATRVMTIDWCGWKDVGMLAAAAGRRNPGAAGAAPTTTQTADAPITIGHPVLERQLSRSPDREVYETVLGAESHWVLADHRIAGHPVIPGTTYLEMVRAALDDRAPGHRLELSDIYFVQPLMVPQGERRIARLELTATAAGWAFSVSSRPEGGGPAQPHVTGNARHLPAIAEQRHDLAAWAARCDQRVTCFTDDDAVDDDHGPRWQCVRKLQWGSGEILAMLELPGEFADDLTRMKLHPAMLDKAIGTGRELAPAAVPYIPYSYRRVVYERPFTRRIHVHTRAKNADSTQGEMPTFNLTITDDSGRQLVSIEEFALKRVHDVRAVYRTIERTRESPGPVLAPTAVTSQGMLARVMEQEGITPEEGAEVFTRLLALPPLSQIAISTTDLNLVLEQGLFPAARAQLAEPPHADDAEPPRPALPLRPRPGLTIPFVDPQGELPQQLASIWRDVLGLDAVGARDNFFDLGGDSVLAIQIVSRIRTLTGKEVAVVQLFESPTVEALAQTLGGDVADSSSDDAATRGARRRAKAVARRQGT